MSQHEGRNAAARLLTVLGLIAAVIWFGNAQVASSAGIAGAAGAAAARQDEVEPTCRHDQISEWSCPQEQEMKATTTYLWTADTTVFDSVTVTVYKRSGWSRKETYPKGTDALFFSKSSVENLLIPYYEGKHTPKDTEKANALCAYVQNHTKK